MKVLDLLSSPEYTHRSVQVKLQDGKALLVIEATRRTTEYESRDLVQRMTTNGRVPASDVFAAWRDELSKPLYARATIELADVYEMDVELHSSRELHYSDTEGAEHGAE